MVGALGPLQSEPVNGVLTIAISEVEGGTRIVWEYNVGGQMRYEVPVIARAVDAVMGLQLAGLAKPLGPVALAAPAAAPDGLVSEQKLVSTSEEAEAQASSPAAPKAPVKPAAAPLVPAAKAPAKPAPAPAPADPKIQAKPAAVTVKPAATAVTPKPAATPLPAPASKPAPKTPSVDEAFSDFKDEPSR
jgi:hypothetical protein